MSNAALSVMEITRAIYAQEPKVATDKVDVNFNSLTGQNRILIFSYWVN